MSLVAYGNSSDEEEDNITDVEDEQMDTSRPLQPSNNGKVGAESIPESSSLLQFPLPTPSAVQDSSDLQEEDDEFLRKKAVPEEKPPPPKKGPVKITIPRLKDFQDLEEDTNKPAKKVIAPSNKPSGLLNMLPKPRAEQLFQPSSSKTIPGMIPKTTTRSLVPDSVKNRKPVATTTSTVSKKKSESNQGKTLTPGYESSDDEDGDNGGDFFSLDKKDTLPEISKNEINLMVAKRAAKIAEATAKLDEQEAKEEQERLDQEAATAAYYQQQEAARTASTKDISEDALQLLVGGSRAKRARMENLDMIELSHEQVMPSRDEWIRTSLASSTEANVRGELKDGPKGVARKKHQITYLAHQAKSNEAELQAMWAANRSTKRQTQSKYGF